MNEKECLNELDFVLINSPTMFQFMDLIVVIRMKFLPLDDSVNHGARFVQF